MTKLHLASRRARLPVLLVALAVTLFTVLNAAAQTPTTPPIIDSFFDDTQPAIVIAGAASPGGGPVKVQTTGTTGNVLGLYRDVYVYHVVGPTNENVTVQVVGGNFSHSTNSGIKADTVLIYDGSTSNYPTTAYNGLCSTACVDLTMPTPPPGTSNIVNAFVIDVVGDDLKMDLRVRVYDGSASGKYSEQTFSGILPGATGGVSFSGPVFIPFQSILAGTNFGGGADFKNVGALEFEFIGSQNDIDITINEIRTTVLDWGDLQDTVGTCTTNKLSGYATTEACMGPRHQYDPTLFLGTLFDPTYTQKGEFDGIPSTYATGDNNNFLNDEDGIMPLVAGGSCAGFWCNTPGGGKIQMTVSGASPGWLVGWIDFDGLGFNNTSDVVVSECINSTGCQAAGTFQRSFTVPPGTIPTSGQVVLHARFRLFGQGEVTAGSAPYAWDGRDGTNFFAPLGLRNPNQSKAGEVEDYVWSITPTAVTLANFSAVQQGSYVLLTWETTNELDNRGFNLWRGTSSAGPDRQLNTTLIPSQSQGNPGGFVYTWEDRADLVPGTSYFYWVEDVDLGGTVTRHGPVSVDYSVPTAVTLSSMDSTAAAGSALPMAGTLVALLAPLAGGLLAARRRRM